MQEQLNSSHQLISCGRQFQDRRSSNRPNPSTDEGLKCPRCDSPNTKFCYYNNYSLAQPRHFCKNCKRYWTKGGALRNVPVGGGCRKNKRAKQRPAGDHDHDHHRHHHIHHPPHSLALAEDQSVLLSSIHCEEPNIASSSTSLDFSLGGHNIFVAADNDHHQRLGDGVGLTFEKLDHGSRNFSCSASPLSINWAAGQAHSSAATLSLQPFRSSILGFNPSGGHQPKQEPVNLYNYNCDLSSIFDPQLNLIGQTSPQISENLRSYHQIYNGLDSFGMAPSGGDIQWRLPTPTLAMVMEGSHAGFSDSRLQDRHSTLENLQPENLRSNTRKSILEEMQVSSCVVDNIQGADRLPVWQSHPEGFFDATTGDGAAAYWSNNSWPQHHEMYEDDQLT